MFKKGEPRPANAGRKKGTPNKRRNLEQLFADMGLDPFAALAEIAKNADDSLRVAALKELCQYLEPKRKAVEHSGEISNPYMEKSRAQLEELVKERLAKK